MRDPGTGNKSKVVSVAQDQMDLDDNLYGEMGSDLPGIEGHVDTAPRAWTGDLSDTNFTARMENDFWILGVKIEAERPVLIQNAYCGVEEMEQHSEMLDFALAFARGDDLGDDESIRKRAMSLMYAKSFFGETGQNLKDGVSLRRTQIEIDLQNLRELKSSEKSADSMIKIADRIETRLRETVGNELVSHLKRSPAGTLAN